MKSSIGAAAAAALSVLAVGQANADQLRYTTTGVSDIRITNRPNGLPDVFAQNVGVTVSVVGDTSRYFDDPAGLRLIYSGAERARLDFQSGVSFEDSLAPLPPGSARIFADGFGDFDGVYAYGELTGSSVDLGDGIGGPGLVGWDGISPLSAYPVSFIGLPDDPGFTFQSGAEVSFLNLRDMTFSASRLGGSFDDPLLVLDDVAPGEGFEFNFTATGGVPVYVDPFVAIGYDYEVGAGSPLIAQALFPVIGSSIYTVYALGDLSTPLFTNVAAGQTIDFTTLAGYGQGIQGFSLRGVDIGAGLDPTDGLAFTTALTFAQSGVVNLTQTPVTAFVAVPEPSAWALMLTGFGGLGAVLRRRRRALVAA